jgi:hypothetical protein
MVVKKHAKKKAKISFHAVKKKAKAAKKSAPKKSLKKAHKKAKASRLNKVQAGKIQAAGERAERRGILC